MKTEQASADYEGLGNRALLDKIDRLRELGISSQIPLPQVSTLSVLFTVVEGLCVRADFCM
jgi:hypothetical protein